MRAEHMSRTHAPRASSHHCSLTTHSPGPCPAHAMSRDPLRGMCVAPHPDLSRGTSLAIRAALAAFEVVECGANPEALRPLVHPRYLRALSQRQELAHKQPPTTRPVIRLVSVHTFEQGPETAEVSLTVAVGERNHAAAVRVEHYRARWRVAALELG